MLFWKFWGCLTLAIKIFCTKISCLSACKNQLSKFVILGILGMPGHTHLKWGINLKKHSTFIRLPPSKVIISSCRKLLCLPTGKKSTSSPMLLWRYCKDRQTYFGYFGHALVLGTLVTFNQNDSITLQKTSIFICMQKIRCYILPYDVTF